MSTILDIIDNSPKLLKREKDLKELLYRLTGVNFSANNLRALVISPEYIGTWINNDPKNMSLFSSINIGDNNSLVMDTLGFGIFNMNGDEHFVKKYIFASKDASKNPLLYMRDRNNMINKIINKRTENIIGNYSMKAFGNEDTYIRPHLNEIYFDHVKNLLTLEGGKLIK